MYYDEIRYEFELTNGVWTDVSEYVVGTDQGEMGIKGWGPVDRVASTGTFKFSMRNIGHMFSPGHINCLAGFETGVHFRLVFVWNNKTRTRFYGSIPPEGIEVSSSDWYAQTDVTVIDYMDQMAIHDLDLPAFAQNKRIDEIVPLIVANMPIAPLATDYKTGTDTFATVFDTVKARTKAMQEITKLCLSELGYAYVTPSWDDDEVLVVEGRRTRVGTPLGQYALSPYELVDIILDNCFSDFRITHGEHYYNAVKATAYPRRVDSSAVILFTLDRVIQIAPGDTVTIKGDFRDPDQQSSGVSGIDMVTPVASTDYLFNANDTGTGADMTADLSVTATYGANGVEYELENTGAVMGYVTLLQARGKGVYTYRPVDYEKEYSTGITADGKRQLTLSMAYQDNPLSAVDFASALLDLYATKRTVVESVTMVANTNQLLLNAFTDLKIGDKIKVIIDSENIDAEYYIHNLIWTIAEGGIVTYTFGLFPASLAPMAAYWQIGEAGYSEIGETTILGF